MAGLDRPGATGELRDALIAILPATLAMVPFGLLLGAAAAQKGLSPVEVLAMSGLVFAGSAQFVAVDLWSDPAPWLGLAFATLLINLRHVLMGASLSGKLGAFSPSLRACAVFFMADEIWAMAERRALSRPLTPTFFFAMAVLLYLNWLLWTVLGTWLGAALGNPAALGFDFAFTAIFIGLVAGFWKGARTGAVIVSSAVVSAAVHLAMDGPYYVLAGALAGIGAAAWLPQALEDAP